MTVVAYPKDPDGMLLQANINALTTQLNNTSATLVKEAVRVKLDQAQRELVYHYLDVGRITAATILSTLS
jgi:hypothetical protein